jgi:transposase
MPPQDWKEARRFRAWELYQQGWTQALIARALGVTPGAVSQWIAIAKQSGTEALHRRPVPGRPPRLKPEQLAQLPALLTQGAPVHGFRGEVWTCPRVAVIIERRFKVKYHPAHVSRLLKRINWAPQKPIRRARQRDEAAIARWRDERWEELQKKPPPKAVFSSL